MNTYIQDKLLEKHICRFHDGECNWDCYIAGMTDYHNHIVEKIEQYDNVWQDSNDVKNGILKLLQDTNPKE